MNLKEISFGFAIASTVGTFNLGSITLEKARVCGATIFGGTILGQFVPPDVLGAGEYSIQGKFSLTGGTSFSGDITVTPTPALLSGLIGIGIAAFRKKKKEEDGLLTAQ